MRLSLSFLFLLFFFLASAQEEIFLENPSFEGPPRLSQTPMAWFDCGFPGESQVDIHPVPAGEFQVNHIAVHGDTYLGMVTRENATWEAIGKKLSQALQGGKAYIFSIHLARSPTYLSAISNMTYSPTQKKINFSTPIKLRIWGGNECCKKGELLAESPLITDTDWQSFDFKIISKHNLDYIIFEAFYNVPCHLPYNGNILLDNISSILEVENTANMLEDSVRVAHLTSLEDAKLFTAPQKDIDLLSKLRVDSKTTPQLEIKPKRPLPKQTKYKEYKEGILSIDDRAFLKEQLSLIKFIPDSQYLEDESMDILIDVVKRINASKKGLKVSFYVNSAEKKWNKMRGREISSLLVNAGVSLMNIKINKSIPAKGDAYFRGGYSDVYLCVY